MTDDIQTVRELLPWYANGTLDEAQRRQVEEAVERSPVLRAELDAWFGVRQHTKDTLPLPAGDLGWSALRSRIAAEEAGKLVPLPRRQAPRWAMPTLALAASLVLAQALVIGVLVREPAGTLVPASGPAATAGTLLQVTFKPTATEQQVRNLLVSTDAEIVGGPGALGVYTLRVPPGTAATAVQRLAQAADLVDSVSVVRP